MYAETVRNAVVRPQKTYDAIVCDLRCPASMECALIARSRPRRRRSRGRMIFVTGASPALTAERFLEDSGCRWLASRSAGGLCCAPSARRSRKARPTPCAAAVPPLAVHPRLSIEAFAIFGFCWNARIALRMTTRLRPAARADPSASFRGDGAACSWETRDSFTADLGANLLHRRPRRSNKAITFCSRGAATRLPLERARRVSSRSEK